MNKGKIVQIIGPVVDVEFPDQLPAIFNALTIEFTPPGGSLTKLTLETQQHLGDNWVRAVAMSTTEGLKRGIDRIAVLSGLQALRHLVDERLSGGDGHDDRDQRVRGEYVRLSRVVSPRFPGHFLGDTKEVDAVVMPSPIIASRQLDGAGAGGLCVTSAEKIGDLADYGEWLVAVVASCLGVLEGVL
jgi:hypothetical protein